MKLLMRSAACLILTAALQVDVEAQAYFGGTVVDANNQPISGATIQAGHMGPVFGPFVLDGQASTDSQGKYAITTLGPGNGTGNYVLVAQAAGRITIIYPNTPCYSSVCPSGGLPSTVSVPNDAVNFQLYHPASISGHIRRTDTNGDVPGMQVALAEQNGPWIYTSTDAAGNYIATNLIPGSYTVQTGYGQVPDQFALLPQVYAGHDFDVVTTTPTADEVMVSDGATVTGIDFALDVGGAIQGTVSSAIDNEPVASGVGIQRLTPVSSGTGFQTGAVTVGYVTNETNPPKPGQYTIEPLLPGTFKIMFSSVGYAPNYFADVISENQAQTVTVTGTATTSGIDAHLEPLQTIAGTITDSVSGLPVSNVLVHGGPALSNFGELMDSVQSLTDGAGNYLLQGLDAGSYYVWIENTPGYFNEVYPNVLGCCFLSGGMQALALTAGQQITGINMAIAHGAYASGHIYDADTGAAPLVSTSIVVYDANGHSVGGAWTDPAGAFTTDAVPTGLYYIAASFGSYQIYYPNYRCASNTTCDLSSAQQLSFTNPQKYIVDFPIQNLDLIFRAGFE